MCYSSGCFMPLCSPAGAHELCQALCPCSGPWALWVYFWLDMGWWLAMKDDICSCTCLGFPTSQPCDFVPALSDFVTLPSASYISSWLWGYLRSPVKHQGFSSAFPCCVTLLSLPVLSELAILTCWVPGYQGSHGAVQAAECVMSQMQHPIKASLLCHSQGRSRVRTTSSHVEPKALSNCNLRFLISKLLWLGEHRPHR